MEKSVEVGVVQMDVKGMDPEANLAHMTDLIRKIVAEGRTHLIVFPELASSGYLKAGDLSFHKDYVRLAQRIPGPFTEGLGAQASRHGVYLVAGVLELHPHIPYMLYNSAVLIGPTGKLLGTYRKLHLPVGERDYFCPGSWTEVFQTDLGSIALQICADGTVPELSRTFALKGAEIVCTILNVPRHPGMDFIEDRLHHIAVCRAIENVNFYVACNRVGRDEGGAYFGHSCVAGPLGQTLAYSTSDREEVLRATLEDEMLLTARARFPYFRDRKPELYRLLAEPL